MNLCAVILAAQDCAALHSKQALHARKLAGSTVLGVLRKTLAQLGVRDVACVVGEHQEQVRKALGEDMAYVLQEERRGTGHAVLQVTSFLESRDGLTLILPGDNPLVRPETLQQAIRVMSEKALDALLLTAQAPLGAPLDWVEYDAAGEVLAVHRAELHKIELSPTEAEGSESANAPFGLKPRLPGAASLVADDRAVSRQRPVSSGIFIFRTPMLLSALGQLGSQNPADGRLDLTQTFPILRAVGRQVATLDIPLDEVRHIRSLADFSMAQRLLSWRQAERLMAEGVEIQQPESSLFEGDIQVGRDTVIEPHVILRGDVQIGEDVRICSGAQIYQTKIGQGSSIAPHTVIEDSEIGANCQIGPNSYLQAGTELQDDCLLAAGCHLANCQLGARVEVEAHARLVDVEVGSDCRIGAGCNTVNRKLNGQSARTVLGSMVVLGSQSSLLAPVHIGDQAVVGSLSVITEDVPPLALAIARQRQENQHEWVRQRLLREN